MAMAISHATAKVVFLEGSANSEASRSDGRLTLPGGDLGDIETKQLAKGDLAEAVKKANCNQRTVTDCGTDT